MNGTTENTTAPESTAPQAKAPVKMTLTSRAKMGAARKARPATKKAAPKVDTAAEKSLRTRKAAKVASNVQLRREPGRNWSHVAIDGTEVGCVFKTSIKGAVCFKAQEGLDRIKQGEDRAFALAGTEAEAVNAFVATYQAG
jgi:hypothetical protein